MTDVHDHVTPLAERLEESAVPLTRPDPDHDDVLLGLIVALTEPWAHVYDVVRDTQDRAGWGDVLDVDNAPSWALDYLANFAGVDLTDVPTDAERRDWIVSAPGQRRGTRAAMRQAGRRHLTGSRLILIEERYGGHAYHIRVTTFGAETPDPARVEAALIAAKPAGLVLTYVIGAGWLWQDLADAHDTWDDVAASYDTWEEAAEQLPPEE